MARFLILLLSSNGSDRRSGCRVYYEKKERAHYQLMAIQKLKIRFEWSFKPGQLIVCISRLGGY